MPSTPPQRARPATDLASALPGGGQRRGRTHHGGLQNSPQGLPRERAPRHGRRIRFLHPWAAAQPLSGHGQLGPRSGPQGFSPSGRESGSSGSRTFAHPRRPGRNPRREESTSKVTVISPDERASLLDVRVLLIPSETLRDIPIVQWKLLETLERRLMSAAKKGPH